MAIVTLGGAVVVNPGETVVTDTFIVAPALSRMSMLVVPADTPVTM